MESTTPQSLFSTTDCFEYRSFSFIDCHAHLYEPQFSTSDIAVILDRASKSGIKHILNVWTVVVVIT